MKKETTRFENSENALNAHDRIVTFDIYENDIQMSKLYLFMDDKKRIVYISLALAMPIGDEIGVYVIPEFGADKLVAEFMHGVKQYNQGLVDFIAVPQQFYMRYPELQELGFKKMPFHEDFMYVQMN